MPAESGRNALSRPVDQPSIRRFLKRAHAGPAAAGQPGGGAAEAPAAAPASQPSAPPALGSKRPHLVSSAGLPASLVLDWRSATGRRVRTGLLLEGTERCCSAGCGALRGGARSAFGQLPQAPSWGAQRGLSRSCARQRRGPAATATSRALRRPPAPGRCCARRARLARALQERSRRRMWPAPACRRAAQRPWTWAQSLVRAHAVHQCMPGFMAGDRVTLKFETEDEVWVHDKQQ